MGRHKKLVEDISTIRVRADETILEDEENLNKTIKWIKDILYSKEDLVSLAAPQIGINSRLFCIKFNDGDIRTFINPMIVHTEGKHYSREKCISIPDKEFIVPRYDSVKLNFQNPTGAIETNIFDGVVSDVVQQMCHIIDGVFIDESGLEVLEGWDDATEEEQQEVIHAWLESVKQQSEILREEINNDEELSRLEKEIEFRTAVAKGEVEFEHDKKLNREERRKLAQVERVLKKRERKKQNRIERIIL